MQTDIIVGVVILAGALLVLLGFTVWSRRRIERIANRGGGTAREILKGVSHE
jgi:uncharacterized iron-regulated membrane protein